MYSLPVSGGQKHYLDPTELKSRHLQGWVPAGGLRGKYTLLSCLISWLMAPPSIFQIGSSQSYLSHMVSPWPPHLTPSSTFKDPCNYIEPIWTIQINLPTSRSTTLTISARRHYYHVSWHSLRSQIPASRMHTCSWTTVPSPIVVSLLSIYLVFNFWCTMDCGTRFPPPLPSQWFLEITEPGT